jgi:hypothetical protein
MSAVGPDNERRRFLRQPFTSRVTCERDGVTTTATLIDISLHGALIDLSVDIDARVGDAVVLTVPLDEGATSITMKTKVAHRSGLRAGLCCVAIDIDDMTHLRRLMELNAGDAQLFVREFSSLGDDVEPTPET